MKKTILNLLFASVLFTPIAVASVDSFTAAMKEQNVSYALSNLGLLVVFGEGDFDALCKLSAQHNADVKIVTNVDRTKILDC